MRIVLTKLSRDMNGPDDFATVSIQRRMDEGYVWDFAVFGDDGLCTRIGTTKIKTEAELRAYIVSGMSSRQWTDMHA